jgi:hypothetical protein
MGIIASSVLDSYLVLLVAANRPLVLKKDSRDTIFMRKECSE